MPVPRRIHGLCYAAGFINDGFLSAQLHFRRFAVRGYRYLQLDRATKSLGCLSIHLQTLADVVYVSAEAYSTAPFIGPHF